MTFWHLYLWHFEQLLFWYLSWKVAFWHIDLLTYGHIDILTCWHTDMMFFYIVLTFWTTFILITKLKSCILTYWHTDMLTYWDISKSSTFKKFNHTWVELSDNRKVQLWSWTNWLSESSTHILMTLWQYDILFMGWTFW